MGLTTGIHVHDADRGRTVALGAGAHPRFSADGRRVVFDRCEDDGDDVTACTLVVAELDRGEVTLRELRGAHHGARHPALSPDGARIAYDADGRIWLGRLEEKRSQLLHDPRQAMPWARRPHRPGAAPDGGGAGAADPKGSAGSRRSTR